MLKKCILTRKYKLLVNDQIILFLKMNLSGYLPFSFNLCNANKRKFWASLMSNVGIWITVAIVLFVLGSIFGLRVSPREKALGLMRDQARKMGLHPRLIVAPEWTKIPMASEKRASMVAYYSVLIPDARLALMRARVVDGKLQVVQGDQKFNDLPIALTGVYAIDMQANCVGLYWDEETDLRATQLEAMKAYLHELAQR
jgi:hypothetical protein